MRQPAALSNASTITRPHRHHWRQTDIVVLRDRLGHDTGYLPSVPPGLPSAPAPAHRVSRLARRRRSTAWEDYNHSRLIGSPRLTSKSLLCNVFVIVPAITRHRWRPAGPARPPRSRVLRLHSQRRPVAAFRSAVVGVACASHAPHRSVPRERIACRPVGVCVSHSRRRRDR